MKPTPLGEIARAVGGVLQGPAGCEVFLANHVTIDSRTVRPGSLFAALPGERTDGHAFVAAAQKAGAVCALVERETVSEGCTIRVDNVAAALGRLAKWYREQFNIPVVAITGSVGKTTTKDMIASVLGQRFQVLKTQGNLNNHLGVPLTLLSLEPGHQAAVIEMGMSGLGEIAYLSSLAQPDVAVITNVGISHIEKLGSRENILKAKCEIFRHLKPGGTAIVNADDEMLPRAEWLIPARRLWYGVENPADVYASGVESRGLAGSTCTIHTPGGEFPVTVPMAGTHMVLNALAATGVGLVLGLGPNEIKAGIETFTPTQMRMTVERTPAGLTVINDAYNANPVSTKAALDVLAREDSRKVAILGDMYELGQFGPEMHREVGEYAASLGLQLVLCVGELSKYTAEGSEGKYFATQEELWQALPELLRPGDVILVKASRGMHLEKTVEKLQEVK